tara:strand:+ start:2056 stop:2376 length:321 start_codon:yes stop_codon:yes gene_type:complete
MIEPKFDFHNQTKPTTIKNKMPSPPAALVKMIQIKWAKQTADSRGHFMRHIDGNPMNNDVSNLEFCHPKDAFNNPEWKVDWTEPLTKRECRFVNDNMSNFASLYTD